VAGHVFHPGHAELHGVTVVLDTTDDRTIVGRYHDTENGVVRLHDVGVHAADAGVTREEFLRRTLKFGVRTEHKFLGVPAETVTEMKPLGGMGG